MEKYTGFVLHWGFFLKCKRGLKESKGEFLHDECRRV